MPNLFLLFDLVDDPPSRVYQISSLWYFLPIGYLFTILIETPVLIVGLSPKVTLSQKIKCGFWLTACTYPIVVIVMPTLFIDQWNWPRVMYLAVAETFAPVAECFLFWLAFRGREQLNSADWVRCFVAIILANLASFGLGEVINAFSWFGLLR